MTLETPLFRIGEIAEKCDAPISRISYVIQKRRIRERQRCGIIRLYDPVQVEMIKNGLAELRPYQKS